MSTSPCSAAALTPSYKLWLVLDSPFVKEGGHYPFTKRELPANENAGFDLYTCSTVQHGAASVAAPQLLDLGVRAMMTRIETGETVHYWLLPRSSIYKTGYMMANSVGVIDRTYRGVLKAPIIRVSDLASGFEQGKCHFQIVAPDMGWIREVEVVESLPETARGAGGFGSTGNT